MQEVQKRFTRHVSIGIVFIIYETSEVVIIHKILMKCENCKNIRKFPLAQHNKQ